MSRVQAPAHAFSSRGFTLIEILVAFLIFAIIGVISSQLLSQTVSAHSNLTERGNRLADAHRAMQIIQRDVMQLVYRPIRDTFDEPQDALLIGSDGAIEFSRLGWRNPLQQHRSEVQRVAYLLQDRELLRGYWTVLDRAPDSEPVYQTLLTDVERMEFYAVDTAGNEYTFWPDPGSSDPTIRLAGIIMRIEMAPFGVVERVWELPDIAAASGLVPGV